MLIQRFVSLVLTGHLRVLRIIGLRRAEQRLQGNERCPDRQRRGPLVLQDVEADRTGLRANIRMPDLSVELHLGRLERIIRRDGNINVEDATFVASVFLNRS